MKFGKLSLSKLIIHTSLYQFISQSKPDKQAILVIPYMKYSGLSIAWFCVPEGYFWAYDPTNKVTSLVKSIGPRLQSIGLALVIVSQ